MMTVVMKLLIIIQLLVCSSSIIRGWGGKFNKFPKDQGQMIDLRMVPLGSMVPFLDQSSEWYRQAYGLKCQGSHPHTSCIRRPTNQPVTKGSVTGMSNVVMELPVLTSTKEVSKNRRKSVTVVANIQMYQLLKSACQCLSVLQKNHVTMTLIARMDTHVLTTCVSFQVLDLVSLEMNVGSAQTVTYPMACVAG